MSTTLEITHQFDAARAAGRVPFRVCDLSLATLGRSEIRVAEHEMPGLMAIRKQYGPTKPLAGARHHRLAAHEGADCRSYRDFETIGADVRSVSCNIFSTQDHAAAAAVIGNGTIENPRGVPVFASEALLWMDRRRRADADRPTMAASHCRRGGKNLCYDPYQR